jgi:hypothetical protein
MPVSANQFHYMTSVAVALAVFSLVAKWYLWPAVRNRPPAVALPPLLLYASLRVNGLMFLMPGLVSPQLPGTFAVPTAYGDLSAALLALVALFCVRTGNAAAKPMTWLFNIIGLTDLTYATYSSFRDHVDPTYLGTSYYLASINVPAMTVVHIVIFAYLLRTWTGDPAVNAATTSVSRRPA